jgi:cytohesin
MKTLQNLCRSPFLHHAAITLAVLAWTGPAFGDEIHNAAASGDMEKVKALLKDNPELASRTDANGLTPLHYAAAADQKDVAELLLANKADVNAKMTPGGRTPGRTPLHFAAAIGRREMVEWLLAHHANINAKAIDGMTPLHIAVFQGHKNVVEVLLASKADVNTTLTVNGETPLHAAAFKDEKELATLLIANKADVNAKDTSGRTPLDFAKLKGHKDMAELLRQHGGQGRTITIHDAALAGNLQVLRCKCSERY